MDDIAIAACGRCTTEILSLRRQLEGAVEENERLREQVASLMLEEPSKTQGLYAAIDVLRAHLDLGGQS
jgi:hypothetical protein